MARTLTDEQLLFSSFVNLGLLVFKAADSYWFSVPNVAAFIKGYKKVCFEQ